MSIAEAVAAALDSQVVTVSVGGSTYTSVAAAAAVPIRKNYIFLSKHPGFHPNSLKKNSNPGCRKHKVDFWDFNFGSRTHTETTGPNLLPSTAH